MPKLRVHTFSVSLDGYGAGPRQDVTNSLGGGGEALWAGLDRPALGYRRVEHVPSAHATHGALARGLRRRVARPRTSAIAAPASAGRITPRHRLTAWGARPAHATHGAPLGDRTERAISG
jgi:hypothetical protein